ncbi:MAG: type II toxin-antitoxin system Phd/YefM family antitoxin [Actinomycetota bacterium]
MIEVGVRELKNALSSYLRLVRQGEIVIVTDRGVPVARVIPAGVPEHIANLMAEGRISWSGKKLAPPQELPRLSPGPPLSDYIAEDRR